METGHRHTFRSPLMLDKTTHLAQGCLGQILDPGHDLCSPVYSQGWGEEVWEVTPGHREGTLLWGRKDPGLVALTQKKVPS